MKAPRRECLASVGFPAKEDSELLAMVSNSICPSVSLAWSRPMTIQGVLLSQGQAAEGDGTSQEVTTEECSTARTETRSHPRAQGAGGRQVSRAG